MPPSTNARRSKTRTPAYESVLAYMREQRRVTGRTQAEVAEALNISRSQYTAIETGRSMLTFDHLYDLACLYDDSLYEFIKSVGI